MSGNSSKYNFRTVSFSTNYTNFSSISIMKQYFMTTDCSDINYIKDYHVEFKHKLLLENGQQMLSINSFYEISSFSKANRICDKADCFIIFFDLENNESLLELNKILKYIKETCDNEKKIFLINIFTNENDIKSNFTQDNIKSCFSNCSLNNYSINTVNMDSSEELAKNIDSITEEILQEKKSLNSGNFDLDNSKSGCLII